MDETISEEEKQDQMNTIYARVSQLEIDITSEAILKIVTPDGEVTNPNHIREFLSETNKEWVRKIRGRVDELNTGMDKSFEVQCPRCEHVWKTEVSFDPSTFFAQGS